MAVATPVIVPKELNTRQRDSSFDYLGSAVGVSSIILVFFSMTYACSYHDIVSLTKDAQARRCCRLASALCVHPPHRRRPPYSRLRLHRKTRSVSCAADVALRQSTFQRRRPLALRWLDEVPLGRALLSSRITEVSTASAHTPITCHCCRSAYAVSPTWAPSHSGFRSCFRASQIIYSVGMLIIHTVAVSPSAFSHTRCLACRPM